MHEFMIYALIGGVGVAILTGMIGGFILWKKMAYFGDALAHAALLGITIALFLEINILIGAAVIAILFSLSLISLKTHFESDTILGILAHSSISLAIICLSFMHNVRIDLVSYLFGDILTITLNELKIIYFLCFLTAIWLINNWKKLLLLAISKDLAKSENVNVKLLNLTFTIIIAMIVVVSVKIVGIILITALLIMPAASARNISKSPLIMVIYSIIFGIASVIIGLYCSLNFDLPSGPSIIITNLGFFLVSLIFS